MRIEGLYRPEVVTADAGESLAVVAQRMREYEIGSLAILEDGGIVGDRDRAGPGPGAGPAGRPGHAGGLVRQPRAQLVEPQEDAEAVARRMLELGVRHLPVVGEGRVVGMLSMRDLLVPLAWVPENQQAR
jgi:CBS domain-containing protein